MPTRPGLGETARAIIADGMGILAADETVSTITKRLTARAIESTADSRRAYRELLFSTPDVTEFIGGVIMQDETIHQRSAAGIPLVKLLADRGIIPGIKVDAGVHPLAGAPGESVTEGLDGLRERLEKYRELGARFAKWRAVFVIRAGLPTAACIHANAHALARYAVLCQEQGLVPIVEPEVLMEGAHALEQCEDVTGRVLQAVFNELFAAGASLEGMLLKPNMVTAGHGFARHVPVTEVAEATLRVLTRHVPPAVPGIVFLSGGQDAVLATEHLNAINALEGPKPWTLSFSYGRALQDEALDAWRGQSAQVPAAQQAFHHRAWCDSAAVQGAYSADMEGEAGFAPSESTLHTHH
ncbi:class I fructose-bisphosphate aldolase [Corallococcus exiguus]|uniref:class I fructose-bisphosphate aldolase n=1 Tax=Corallococcus exiguus TaxID=83462 RepID=UPI001561936B|nr:class I fructose-bisphosphate aldolase [Corallococcus exiguus]NRD45363.1 fructose-bisphosphate aldolase class I [Corallococcus exiguus]